MSQLTSHLHQAIGSAIADEHRILHRGIAARAFERSFVLADGVEVAGAGLDHGLLNIELRRQVPETIVQTIKIGRK